MSELAVRPAQEADIPQMLILWQEKLQVQQQYDQRFTLAADAASKWSETLRQRLAEPGWIICVAERDDEIIGYIMAYLQSGPPGLLPAQIGMIEDMVVGIHSQQNGLGSLLMNPVRQWLRDRGISHLMVEVPRFQPVEQAFWRAQNAVDAADVLWVKV